MKLGDYHSCTLIAGQTTNEEWHNTADFRVYEDNKAYCYWRSDYYSILEVRAAVKEAFGVGLETRLSGRYPNYYITPIN